MRNPDYPLDEFDVPSDFDESVFDLVASRHAATAKVPTSELVQHDSEFPQVRGQVILCLLFAVAIALRSLFVS
ncbi:hypothetical protein RMSM_02103 [Rhodopirellula maiorica SM1]|uniref:Uncharacterized protein n=2 Tax=Novipirellula TaxID=2795426 RepID=M5RZY2_9BACT|nr:hypothetical protein RMSM_02103 [Rhodopirellula maiorica SM1]